MEGLTTASTTKDLRRVGIVGPVAAKTENSVENWRLEDIGGIAGWIPVSNGTLA